MENIRILQELGYEVDVAADFTDTSVWSNKQPEKFKGQLNRLGIPYFQIGRKIWNSETYQYLVDMRSNIPQESRYFPVYRA